MNESRSAIAVSTISVKLRIIETVAIIGADTMGMASGRALNKQPALTRKAFGFIGNCICNAYRRQCKKPTKSCPATLNGLAARACVVGMAAEGVALSHRVIRWVLTARDASPLLPSSA